ncbi:MAG: adenylate/guanylate cyclase domain-containing protein [Candidatus Eisenbacteria bacterium]|nr:adenylate/guanylate cyclase domain-containing protein [Candidatus Eisenbacteria bacterium]
MRVNLLARMNSSSNADREAYKPGKPRSPRGFRGLLSSFRPRGGLLVPLIISLISASLTLILLVAGVFYPAELKSVDLRFRIRGESKGSSIVSIVTIDEKSEEGFGEKWPWRRIYHALLIDALTDFGTRAEGFDVFFSSSKDDDAAFRESILRNGHVHLGQYFELGRGDEAEVPGKDANSLSPQTLKFSIPFSNTRALPAKNIFPPNETLLSAAAGVGFEQLDPDIGRRGLNSDGTARKYPVLVSFQGRLFPSIALSIACDYFDADLSEVTFESGRWVVIPGGLRLEKPLRIPVDREGQMIVNWTGKWDGRYGIKKFSYFDICESRNLILNDLQPRIAKEKLAELQGRVVLIGDATLDSQDRATIPFETLYPMVGFQANALHTILERSFLTLVPMRFMVLVILVLSFGLAYLVSERKAITTLLIFVVFGAGYFALSCFLFARSGLITDLTAPTFSLFGTFVGTVGYRFEKERRERQRISNTFGKYVSPDVLGEILKNRQATIPGEKRDVSILFSDVRGFTTISETLSAEELVPLINEYLTAMTEIIFSHGGTVNKFVGDAIMAIFGAPVACDDHPDRALRTAIAMMTKVREMSARWKEEGKPPLDIGVGINTGIVFAGNVGSVERMEYTVMGDGVNVASRLESLNKDYGTHIIVSTETLRRAKGKFMVRELGTVSLKGRKEPVSCCELLGAGN